MHTHILCTLDTGLLCPLLCPWHVIIVPMDSTHPYISFKNLGKKCTLYMAKYGAFTMKGKISPLIPNLPTFLTAWFQRGWQYPDYSLEVPRREISFRMVIISYRNAF